MTGRYFSFRAMLSCCQFADLFLKKLYFYIVINRQKKKKVKSDLGYQGTPQPRALKGWDGCTWKGREMCFRQHFAGVGG